MGIAVAHVRIGPINAMKRFATPLSLRLAGVALICLGQSRDATGGYLPTLGPAPLRWHSLSAPNPAARASLSPLDMGEEKPAAAATNAASATLAKPTAGAATSPDGLGGLSYSSLPLGPSYPLPWQELAALFYAPPGTNIARPGSGPLTFLMPPVPGPGPVPSSSATYTKENQ
jgi:hypothetical protein